MRIVMVSDCYPPHMGGIESQVEGLASRLASRGHRVEVLTASPGPVVDEARGEGRLLVHRHALPLPGFLPATPVLGSEAKRVIDRSDVVHVHAGVVSPFAWAGMRAAGSARKPVVVTFHCMLKGWGPALRTLRPYRGEFVATAVSSRLAEEVKSHLGISQVGVVTNGVELSRWRHIAACRPRPARPSHPLQLVSAMRLMPRKRPVALVRIMSRVRKQLGAERCPRLTIYGEGAALPALKAAVRAHRVSDVITCPGRLDEAGLRLAYLRADGFVMASTLESFGIAALEARASGLPVLARAGTGLSEFITSGSDGFLAEDDDRLADEILRCAKDPQHMSRYLEEAQVSPTVSWASSIAACEETYRRAGAN